MAEVFEQASSGLREVESVKSAIKSELASLQADTAKEAFYTKEGEKVKYDLQTVHNFLNQQKVKTWQEVRNSHATMMGVQILLESKGYDIGKIDGMLGSQTKNTIKSFQQKNGLPVDGLPGPVTIAKLLDQKIQSTTNKGDTPQEKKNLDKYGNTQHIIRDLSQLPEGYVWNENLKKSYVYEEYTFYANGRAWNSRTKKTMNTEDAIKEINNSKTTVGGLEHRQFVIQDLKDLPKGYTRTGNTIYKYGRFIFYNNGRVKDTNTNEIHNTRKIIDQIQHSEKKEGENTIITINSLSDLPKNFTWTKTDIRYDYKNYRFYNNGRVYDKTQKTTHSSKDIVPQLQ